MFTGCIKKSSKSESSGSHLSEYRYKRLGEFFDSKNERQIHSRLSEESRVKLNASGLELTISHSLLRKHSNSLLGNPNKLVHFWSQEHNAYFFDRDCECFKSLLNFYRTGTLTRPKDVTVSAFLQELIFFEMDNNIVKKYIKDETGHDEISILNDDPPSMHAQYWQVFTSPYSSVLAFIISTVRVVLIVLSTMIRIEMFIRQQSSTAHHLAMLIFKAMNHPCIMLNLILTLDLLIRIFSCPNLNSLWRPSIISTDIVARFAFFLTLILEQYMDKQSPTHVYILIFVQNFQTFSFFHFMDFFRTNTTTRTLTNTIYKHWLPIVQLIQVIIISAILSGAVIFLIESMYEMPVVNDIPEGAWWGLVSLLTIGYGDIVPKTTLSTLVAAVLIFLGQIVTAMIVPIAINLYTEPYTNIKDVKKMLRKIVQEQDDNRNNEQEEIQQK